jgi:NADPH-dependent curcumin reductase CurA
MSTKMETKDNKSVEQAVTVEQHQSKPQTQIPTGEHQTQSGEHSQSSEHHSQTQSGEHQTSSEEQHHSHSSGEHHHKEHHSHSGEHQTSGEEQHHSLSGEHQTSGEEHHHSHSSEHHHHHHKEQHSHSGDKIIKEVPEYKIGEKEVNQHYIYSKHPTEQFTEDVFRFEETQIPRDPSSENEILVRLTYISIDPFIRNRMCEKSEFIQPFKLNDVLEGEATAEIIKSNNSKYPVGQSIVGYLKWTRYQIINTQHLPVNLIPKDIEPSCFLSIFGMPGLTAYFGITEYVKVKPQHNVLVSGACGSVGLFVGQIMRIMGCEKLIGLDCSDDKIKQSLLFGYNQCFNAQSQDLDQALTTAFPEGIDIYWDNVGGPILDTVIEHMRPHGRIIMCGTKSEAQSSGNHLTGITKFDSIIAKSITIQGLFYYEFSDRFAKAYKKLLHWYHDGKIKTKETTLEGFQHVPKAFSSLMSGETIGKTLVHIERAQVA